MTHRGESRVARGHSRSLLVAFAILIVASAAIVTVAVSTGSGPAATSSAPSVTTLPGATSSATTGTTPVPAKAGRQTGAVTPEPPQAAELPSGKVVPIEPVATTSDGTLDVPGDITVSGWWRGGSRLGDPFGSTLLSAHVDSSTQGLGPYAELLSITAGESVVVTSENLRQVFTVTSLELIDKGTLSARPVIFSASGERRLTLVTCAGPYLPGKGGYQRLAVVTATAIGQPTPRGG